MESFFIIIEILLWLPTDTKRSNCIVQVNFKIYLSSQFWASNRQVYNQKVNNWDLEKKTPFFWLVLKLTFHKYRENCLRFILFGLLYIKNYQFIRESDTDQWPVVQWAYPKPHQGWYHHCFQALFNRRNLYLALRMRLNIILS